MGLTTRLLASGTAWRVTDVVCDSGPADPPFEEEHQWMCIAAVTRGTFQYRSTRGDALLVPGAILLGNAGDEFECGHDHSTGDRCLAFQLSPEFFEQITCELRGMEPTFLIPRLAPLELLTPLLATAQVARDEADVAQLEELTVRITAAVAATLRGTQELGRAPTASDIRRVSEVMRWIEQRIADHLTLHETACMAAMSPFHFLRTFREVVGVTPHQYLLRMRLKQACVQLRSSNTSIAAIALEAGFSDLSTFNRQFRRIVKTTPTVYRARASLMEKPLPPTDH